MYRQKDTISTMNEEEGLVKFWGCFAAAVCAAGCLESVQGTIKSADSQGIPEQNVLPCVREQLNVGQILAQNTAKTQKNLQEQNIG